ncbi:hypothetical protein [Chryseobacterium sp. ERMR1:04]|uniref:hypothetical protein n=1 Tax=Chryseobacterium sp. ERMR1:04 TaxID=1705393 RepID=UPI0006C8CEB0|nr:hypothetical protein [Chryseobacterium sp. ERMR1:04]KPH14106.1 hypothetical protein AMQ68_00850 [Chryseobacterium sp. ERMR1:04]
MKLANKHCLELFFSFVILLFLYNCRSSSAKFYYDDRIVKTDYEKKAEEIYLNDIPKEYQKTDKDVLLIFSGSAFKGKTIVINNRDSISFKSEAGESGCYGTTFRKINKSENKIKLSVEGKKDIIIPFIQKYDYIDVGDATKAKWGVGYSKILPSYFCM